MAKIAFIGAGSVVFTRNLVSDILTYPALSGSTIALMDIDPERLRIAGDLTRKMVQLAGADLHVETTLDRKQALKQADYVIITIQVGGLDIWKMDIDIPQKYGVGQCIGDTLGPGGVFRALRHMSVIDEIALEMEQLCPNAVMLQYTNPMAMICSSVFKSSSIPIIGLCHSVQGDSEMLANLIGAPFDEMTFYVAGINHMAWFLKMEWNGKDVNPLLREIAMDPAIYGEEPVRFDLYKHFGYFVTESSGHASEYFPYFRKRPDLLEELVGKFTSPKSNWLKWGKTGGGVEYAYERLDTHLDDAHDQISGKKDITICRSKEYGVRIINAMETHTPIVVNGNVRNTGLITNLPQDCCVEVPCLIDRNGIHPSYVGALPPTLAALNRTNINVQELAVEGHRKRSRQIVKESVMLDPLTAAVCSLDEISSLVDEMFDAQAAYLPQFQKA